MVTLCSVSRDLFNQTGISYSDYIFVIREQEKSGYATQQFSIF